MDDRRQWRLFSAGRGRGHSGARHGYVSFQWRYRRTRESEGIPESLAKTSITNHDGVLFDRFAVLLECADADPFDRIKGGRAAPKECGPAQLLAEGARGFTARIGR
jgi:hypothetical protein